MVQGSDDDVDRATQPQKSARTVGHVEAMAVHAVLANVAIARAARAAKLRPSDAARTKRHVKEDDGSAMYMSWVESAGSFSGVMSVKRGRADTEDGEGLQLTLLGLSAEPASEASRPAAVVAFVVAVRARLHVPRLLRVVGSVGCHELCVVQAMCLCVVLPCLCWMEGRSMALVGSLYRWA